MLCSWWLLVLFMVIWYVTLCSLVCSGEWYLTNYVVRSLFQSRHKFIQYFLLLLCLQMPYHERADPRFVWNGHLLRELANQPELCRFCLPLLHGCILLVLSITYAHTHAHTCSFMHACMHSFIHSFVHDLCSFTACALWNIFSLYTIPPPNSCTVFTFITQCSYVLAIHVGHLQGTTSLINMYSVYGCCHR